MADEPEYKLDDSVTEQGLLFRIARELTTLRKQTTEMISYLRDAAANCFKNPIPMVAPSKKSVVIWQMTQRTAGTTRGNSNLKELHDEETRPCGP